MSVSVSAHEGTIPFKGFRPGIASWARRRAGKTAVADLARRPRRRARLPGIARGPGRHRPESDLLRPAWLRRSATPSQPGDVDGRPLHGRNDVVRQALGLDHIHLLGQSWGGCLAHGYC